MELEHQLEQLRRTVEALAPTPWLAVGEVGCFVEHIDDALRGAFDFRCRRVHEWAPELRKKLKVDVHDNFFQALDAVYADRNIAYHPNPDRHRFTIEDARSNLDTVRTRLASLARLLEDAGALDAFEAELAKRDSTFSGPLEREAFRTIAEVSPDWKRVAAALPEGLVDAEGTGPVPKDWEAAGLPADAWPVAKAFARATRDAVSPDAGLESAIRRLFEVPSEELRQALRGWLKRHISTDQLGAWAERALTSHLVRQGHHVVPTHAFHGNTDETPAPMMVAPDNGLIVLPDLLCFPPGGGTPFWYEVKCRTEPGWHRKARRFEHGINARNNRDYVRIAEVSGLEVRIAVLELFSPSVNEGDGEEPPALNRAGTWLEASLATLQQAGHRVQDWPQRGHEGFLWPRAAMSELKGPEAEPDPVVLEPAPTADPAPLPSALHVEPRYSALFFRCTPTEAEVEGLIARGIRVFMFDTVLPAWVERVDEQTRLAMLHVQVVPESIGGGFCVVDGKADRKAAKVLRQIDALVPFQGSAVFNLGQYEIIHADPSRDIEVTAGAGTGKTTVMMERIMFLLQTQEELEPVQIRLLTFTREAARIMRERLRDALILRLRVTKNPRFFHWLKQLPAMGISTIHAFGRELITDSGAHLGLGSSISLSNLTLVRRRILEEEIDAAMANPAVPFDGPSHAGSTLYEVQGFLDSVWRHLENRGLVADDVAALDWGKPADGDSVPLHALMTRVIARAEKRLNEHKQQNNVLAVTDLIRHLRGSTDVLGVVGKKRAPLRYLFIDEFQDTDDSQIELFISLRRALGLHLFVVGDIKQSIYRFRGADYTAFDRLREDLEREGAAPARYSLTWNFRSLPAVLQCGHRRFVAWADRRLLRYGDDDALRAARVGEGDGRIEDVPHRDIKQRTVAAVRNELSSGRTVTLLAYANFEVGEVSRWLKDEGIPCDAITDGDFFRCEAVADVQLLVRALLYPRDPVSRAAYAASLWSDARIPWFDLAREEERNDARLELLSRRAPDDLDPLVERSRLVPLPSLLLDVIKDRNPAQRHRDRVLRALESMPGMAPDDRCEQADLEGRRYAANLSHLLTLVHERLPAMSLSVADLDAWLTLSRATDTSENEPTVDDLDMGVARVMTVHRAKGDEFQSVILPLTGNAFVRESSQTVLEADRGGGARRVGWRMRVRRSMRANSHFADLWTGEIDELDADHARNLYVAMTRAKDRLLVLRDDRVRAHSWSELLG